MGKNSDSGFWGCFGALIGLVIVGAMGYGLYWLITPTDYVGKIESAIEKIPLKQQNQIRF